MMDSNFFKNLELMDKSYLLDPSVVKDQTEKANLKKESATPIEINKLVSFKNHPFHVNTAEEAFQLLIQSIEEHGVLNPIIVRPDKGETGFYEILSGHCRVQACRQLGIKSIPAYIKDVDDLLATVIMTHSNISGRDKIALSEKAKAYRMCMDQEKHQGSNKGFDTAEFIGAGKDSRAKVYRILRLSYLVPRFAELLDQGRLSIQTAYELAFIRESGQEAIWRFIEEFNQIPSLDEAKELRLRDENASLNYEVVIGMLAKTPANKQSNKLYFKTKDIAAYFEEDTELEEMENIIFKLLEKYKAGKVKI